MWYPSYKQLDDRRRLMSYEDDTLLFITGRGTFDEVTAEHAIEVLDRTMSRYSESKLILNDRGFQFYVRSRKEE